MYVKPKNGLLIRDPVLLHYLPEDGQDVDESDPYWQRHLRDESIERCKPPKPKAAPSNDAKGGDA